jgi:polyhydroxybutyrate depolymerase
VRRWLPARRAAVLCCALACAGAGESPPLAVPGDHDVSIEVGGRERTAWVHVPPAVRVGAPLPVVVAYHGGGGNAEGYRDYSGLDPVADREGFAVVYPDGTGRLGRRLLTWNAGGCCGRAQEQGVDDVAFTWALLAELARGLPLDATRVYATGHSNGAMMSYRLAAESAERVAAIAPVAGAMMLDDFAPSRPVPVMHVHSVDDPRALFAGGLGPRFPFTNRRVEHRPVMAGLERWIRRNGCPPGPHVGRRVVAPEGRSDAGHTATQLVFAPCESGADVVLWKLTGAGHGWPGGKAALPERWVGPNTQVIDASEEAWRFFQRFRRPDAPPLR